MHSVKVVRNGVSWADSLIDIGDAKNVKNIMEQQRLLEHLHNSQNNDWLQFYHMYLGEISDDECDQPVPRDCPKKCYKINELAAPPPLGDLVGEVFKWTHIRDFDKFFIIPQKLIGEAHGQHLKRLHQYCLKGWIECFIKFSSYNNTTQLIKIES